MNNFIKLMLIVPLMAINYLYAQSNVKASADLASKWELSSGDFTGKADTKMGFSVGAEFMKPMNNNVAIGGGAQFQLPRALKDASSVKFNFIPVYAVGTFFTDYGNGIYGKGALGYNLHSGNSEYKSGADLGGGLYYGIGGGYAMNKKMLFEVMYTVNNGAYEDADVKYGKISISAGIIFGQ